MGKAFKLLVIFGVLMVTGCAGPRITGSAIPQNVLDAKPDIISIDDDETRQGFQQAVEGWLASNGLIYTVAPENSLHDPDKLTIEYEGVWRWDMALYLSRAHLEAFYKGQRVSKVSFVAPNSLNTNKWGKGEERIHLMMDVLFGKKSSSDATNDL
tara:strand:+ start:2373 stop:2837 length:465 start_codon:yes stop_codon:yes gene_type:complete